MLYHHLNQLSFSSIRLTGIISIPFLKTTSKIPKERSSLLDGPRNNVSLPSIRSEQYQSKICELSNQVKFLRERLVNMENQKGSSAEQEIASLQVENARLMRQNKALRVRIHELEGELKKKAKEGNIEIGSVKSQGAIRPNHRSMKSQEGLVNTQQFEKIDSGVTTTQLLRQLLAQCNEPNECGQSMRSQKLKDDFYQFKSSSDCFEPWLSQLSKEMRVRLKRSLTRQKELLFTSSLAEIGCICPYLPSTEDPFDSLKILIVLTNLAPVPLLKVAMSPLHAKDIALSRKGKERANKWEYHKEIRPNEQIRQEVEVVVNNIDFRCVQLELEFQGVGGQKNKELLILPLSKGKLFRWVPYTAPPGKAQRVERVFEYEKKVLSEVERINKLWGVVQGKEKVGGRRFYWKICFLGRYFWLQAGRVQEKLMMGIKFQSQRALAQKVLQEYVFLFQKL